MRCPGAGGARVAKIFLTNHRLRNTVIQYYAMEKPKIGFSSFALRWHMAEGTSVFELPALAQHLGAEVVQLCENTRLEQLSPCDVRELRESAEKAGIALEVGISGGSSVAIEEGIRSAEALGARILRSVVDSDGLSPEDVAVNIRAVLPKLRSSGIILCLENHFRFSPAVLADIILGTEDENIAACLDPLNSMALLVGPEEAGRILGPLAGTAHIKDAVMARNGTGFVLSGRPIGRGMLDIGRFLAGLSPNTQSVLVEGWMDKMTDREQTLAEESAWLQSGLEFLRRHI